MHLHSKKKKKLKKMSASWKTVLEQLHFLGKSKVSKRLKGKKTQWQAQAESTESVETVPGIRISQTQRSLSMMILLRHWGNNASNSQCYHEGVKSRLMQSPHPHPSHSFMFTVYTALHPFHQ